MFLAQNLLKSAFFDDLSRFYFSEQALLRSIQDITEEEKNFMNFLVIS